MRIFSQLRLAYFDEFESDPVIQKALSARNRFIDVPNDLLKWDKAAVEKILGPETLVEESNPYTRITNHAWRWAHVHRDDSNKFLIYDSGNLRHIAPEGSSYPYVVADQKNKKLIFMDRELQEYIATHPDFADRFFKGMAGALDSGKGEFTT